MTNRLPYIDTLRGWAIILMIINHVGHYAVNGYNNLIIYLVIYLTVTMAAPLFLFLVGFSLVLSDRNEKFIKYLKRGLSLIILGFLVNGFFYFDEPLYRGRVLFLIGLSIMVSYPFLSLIKRYFIIKFVIPFLAIFGLFFSGSVILVNYYLDNNIIREIFFSEFVFFPWFLLVLLGLLFGNYWVKLTDSNQKRSVKFIFGGGILMLLIWFFSSILSHRYYLWNFSYDFNLNGYWLPSIITWFWVIGLVLIFFSAFYYFYQFNNSILLKILKRVENIGRYSIYVYFLQFFLIKTILEKLFKTKDLNYFFIKLTKKKLINFFN